MTIVSGLCQALMRLAVLVTRLAPADFASWARLYLLLAQLAATSPKQAVPVMVQTRDDLLTRRSSQ